MPLRCRMKVGDGVYGKWAVAEKLRQGYQTRLACLPASDYGAPQNRWRVFVVGARPEEHLPAVPLVRGDRASVCSRHETCRRERG